MSLTQPQLLHLLPCADFDNMKKAGVDSEPPAGAGPGLPCHGASEADSESLGAGGGRRIGGPAAFDLTPAGYHTSAPTGENPDAIAVSDELNQIAVLKGTTNTLHLFQMDPHRSEVVKPTVTIGGPGDGPMQFMFPLGGTTHAKMAYAKAGDIECELETVHKSHLLVVDTGNDRVQEIDAVTHAFVGFLIHKTSPFKAPTGVAASAAYIGITAQINQYTPGGRCGSCRRDLVPRSENQVLLFSATYRPGTTLRPLLWCVDGVASRTPRGLSLPF